MKVALHLLLDVVTAKAYIPLAKDVKHMDNKRISLESGSSFVVNLQIVHLRMKIKEDALNLKEDVVVPL